MKDSSERGGEETLKSSVCCRLSLSRERELELELIFLDTERERGGGGYKFKKGRKEGGGVGAPGESQNYSAAGYLTVQSTIKGRSRQNKICHKLPEP